MRDELVASMPKDNLLSFARWVCVQARCAEDLVERTATAGISDQYIILGAGLDTFAHRRQDLSRRVRVFEVAHPPAGCGLTRSRTDTRGDVGRHPAMMAGVEEVEV